MRVAILITARLGSTRLPGKHLLEVGGRPILQYLVDSINREFLREIGEGRARLAIATSERPENAVFRERITGAEVLFGDDENIPLRHLKAGVDLEADAILSIDGDDILCSRAAMRSVFEALNSGTRYVKTHGLPLGMNASGYSMEVLRRSIREGEGVFETGWVRIFEKEDPLIIDLACPDDERLRFTLDYDVDYRFFTAVLTDPEFPKTENDNTKLVDLVLSRKYYEITLPIVKEYWENFYSSMEEEKRRNRE